MAPRGMPERRHLTVVCALIERTGRLLAAKRPNGKARSGKWEFPGGKVHDGESPEAAIVREINEELGCEVRPITRFATSDHAYADLDVTLLPFLCVLLEGVPRALEHEDIRWVDSSDFAALDWSDADLPIAAAYFSTTR